MEKLKYAKPIWFDIDKSKLLNTPNDNTYYKTPFTKKDVNIKTSIYKTTTSPKIKYENNKSFNYNDELHKLLNNFQNKISKQQKKDNTKTKIKTLCTKLIKETNSLNTVIRVNKYQLDLNKSQQTIIQSWIAECKKVYNKCIDKYKANNNYFNNKYCNATKST